MNRLLGAVAGAAMMAGATTAYSASVPLQSYEGLAFNSLDSNLIFSRANDTNSFGPTSTAYDLVTPANIADNLGQVIYTVETGTNPGAAINNATGLHNAIINFSESAKAMQFNASASTGAVGTGHNDSFTLRIKDGQFKITGNCTGCDGSPSSEFPKPTGPGVTLPFGLGTAFGDYYLTGHLDMEVKITSSSGTFTFQEKFLVCVDSAGSGTAPHCTDTTVADDNNRSDPFGSNEPFNQLNVGDNGNGNDGSEDMAMFVYLVSENGINSCGTYCDWANATEKMYIKLALWGDGDTSTNDVMEPTALAALAMGLIGMGVVRRRRTA
jgi:hypothetical protein